MQPEVILYTKGHCPFCRGAKALLSAKGVTNWTEYDLEVIPEKRNEMLQLSNGRHTVPQIFINGHHVGGGADIDALEQRGELDALLQDIKQTA